MHPHAHFVKIEAIGFACFKGVDKKVIEGNAGQEGVDLAHGDDLVTSLMVIA